jgi:exodeoxyribonuclease V gamma subunit
VETETEDINVSELLRFYSHPQRYFVQQSLGVSLGDEDVVPEDSEMFLPDGLDQYAALQMMLDSALGDQNYAKLDNRLCAEGLWPLGTPGELLFAEKSREIKTFAEIIGRQNMGKRLPDLSIDYHVGPYRLLGTLKNRYERGNLLTRYANLKGKDLLGAWLHHLLALGAKQGGAQTLLIMKDKSAGFDETSQDGPGLEELIRLFVHGKNGAA